MNSFTRTEFRKRRHSDKPEGGAAEAVKKNTNKKGQWKKWGKAIKPETKKIFQPVRATDNKKACTKKRKKKMGGNEECKFTFAKENKMKKWLTKGVQRQ